MVGAVGQSCVCFGGIRDIGGPPHYSITLWRLPLVRYKHSIPCYGQMGRDVLFEAGHSYTCPIRDWVPIGPRQCFFSYFLYTVIYG